MDTTSQTSSQNDCKAQYESINRTKQMRGDDGWPVGAPIQILELSKDLCFKLDLDALSNVLLRDSIRDKPVVVVSIAGEFSEDNGLVVNSFLRYLQSGFGATTDWLAGKDQSLNGFSWSTNLGEDTGIYMWSEPFLFKKKDGKEGAIVLIANKTAKVQSEKYSLEKSKLFVALSTMTSSILVLNLRHNLQEDNLHCLAISNEYGRLALERSHQKPFQKLVFLIRDWSSSYEHPQGLKDGQSLLLENLAIIESQPTQLQRARSCFQQISCFLMPQPGTQGSINPNFGRCGDVDCLNKFVPLMLDPINVVIKEIGGRQVTGQQLMQYFEAYDKTLPEPSAIMKEAILTPLASNFLEMTSDVFNKMALSSVLTTFDADLSSDKLSLSQIQDYIMKALKDFETIVVPFPDMAYSERLENMLTMKGTQKQEFDEDSH